MKLPKGLMILSVFTIVAASLSTINCVVRPDIYMIYAGQVLEGLPFKIYYSILGATGISIGVGLLFRRRWSYLCFLALNAYYGLIATANIIITDNEALIRAGWRLADNNLRNFRLLQAGVLCGVLLMTLWLCRYRGEFRQDSANHGIHRIADKSGSR